MKKSLLFLLLLNYTIVITAQKFEGIATYKTDISINMEESSMEGVDEAMMKQIMEQMKAQFRKEFTLKFTPTESYYSEVAKLDAPSVSNNPGLSVTVSGGNELVYRNTDTNSYSKETNMMGKDFLIENQMQDPEWILEKESKNIGQHLCFKATRTDTITEKKMNTETMEFDEVKKEKITTAWYTPSIPVPHGPDAYFGLPGLILEISDGEVSILCIKITLNPKDGVIIKKPSNGKKVDQKTYDEIQKKKSAEMMESFQGSGRKNEGNKQLFRIKTGGK